MNRILSITKYLFSVIYFKNRSNHLNKRVGFLKSEEGELFPEPTSSWYNGKWACMMGMSLINIFLLNNHHASIRPLLTCLNKYFIWNQISILIWAFTLLKDLYILHETTQVVPELHIFRDDKVVAKIMTFTRSKPILIKNSLKFDVFRKHFEYWPSFMHLKFHKSHHVS